MQRLGLAAALAAGTLLQSDPAAACGCLSPPVPSLDDESFGVNQQSESILFEVEPGFVTAHVLIRYAGAPESFAWIVPVPSVPELEISNPVTFGLIESATNPQITTQTTDLCPVDEYRCETHPDPYCPDAEKNQSPPGSASSPTGNFSSDSAAAGGASASAGGIESVRVFQREQIGSYDTVTFGAGDVNAAIDWLNEEGFITNQTMAPYMQPYVEAGMLFVASKLIPGAGVDEIRPLSMRFAAEMPMIPLQLTAIAAEPHLTVTAYIFSSSVFEPAGKALISLDPRQLGADSNGRGGYPMLLARAIDEAGGHAFVDEYSGVIPPSDVNLSQPCCTGEGFRNPAIGGQGGELAEVDFCGLGNDGQCQCPTAAFDEADCSEGTNDLLDGLELYERLRSKYSMVTRLTTRVSPEEMTIDPGFVASTRAPQGRLVLQGQMQSLQNCQSDIIDFHEYQELAAISDCSAVYCGEGECVATANGAGCLCAEGYVARSFRDLDGQQSMTCVPEENPVDFAAGGAELPSACDEDFCGNTGTCVDLGGFPACACDDEHAGVAVGSLTVCAPITHASASPGAGEYTEPMLGLDVCAPVPPVCGKFGWLELANNKGRHGVTCQSSLPSQEAKEPPREPTCEDYYPEEYIGDLYVGPKNDPGCGCSTVGQGGKLGGVLASLGGLLLGAFVLRRRRRAMPFSPDPR